MIKAARIEGEYRYTLTRRWNEQPAVMWVMLNPSTADAETDDPTILRCISFAKFWGLGGIEVVNLFALRATKPTELQLHADPIGPRNEGILTYAMRYHPGPVVVAWGTKGKLFGAGPKVALTARPYRSLFCLGTNADESPKHPLYVKGGTPLEPYP